jgi:RNA recognition motif-containing protein
MAAQTRLFVRNLSWSVTENHLYDLFSEVGEVVSIKIPTRQEDGKPRGFAFVEMQSNNLAQDAIQRFNGITFQNRDLVVNFQDETKGRSSRSSFGETTKNSKLFVRNLNYSLTEQVLQALFEQVGVVYSAKIAMDRETGISKGFAFIEMATADDAQQAINKLNNSVLEGKEISIDFQDPTRARNKRPYHNNSFNRSGGGHYGQGFSNYADRW